MARYKIRDLNMRFLGIWNLGFGIFKDVRLVRFATLFATSCTEEKQQLTGVFPIDTWQERSPEELFIAVNGHNIYKGDSIYKKHNRYSSSKSFTSAVLDISTDQKNLFQETYANETDSYCILRFEENDFIPLSIHLNRREVLSQIQ